MQLLSPSPRKNHRPVAPEFWVWYIDNVPSEKHILGYKVLLRAVDVSPQMDTTDRFTNVVTAKVDPLMQRSSVPFC